MDAAGDVGDGDHGRAAVGELERGDRRRRCRSPGRRSAARRGSSRAARRRARSTITTPAPVASCRKTEPPIEIGLPVTISGTAWPTCIEYVSIIQAIVCSFVAMSGAGMSSCGPIIGSELGGEAARQPLELAQRQLARVAADAALRAAVGQAQERALPGHPHRERRALAERHLRVVADAALRRAEHGRVLDAVAGEDRAAAVVEPDRHGDHDRALRVAQAARRRHRETSAYGSACSNCAIAVPKSGVSHSRCVCAAVSSILATAAVYARPSHRSSAQSEGAKRPFRGLARCPGFARSPAGQ